ncbi:MAG: acireductone synthase [Halothiobacillaceae bacterium]
MTVRAVLTDIEGTTSSLSFVKDVLFPYARAQLGDYLREQADELAVAEQLSAVRREIRMPDASLEQVIDTLIKWIDEDRKITPLKALQGLVWAEGYRRGDFRGHVYDDAVAGLRRWKAAGLDLYVYSSGSVQAQKLLFGHSEAGDLTGLFSGYFDTRVGQKREAESYRQIAQQIGLPAEQILFLSDVPGELSAAHQAGMPVIGLARGADPMAALEFSWVRDFNAIDPQRLP